MKNSILIIFFYLLFISTSQGQNIELKKFIDNYYEMYRDVYSLHQYKTEYPNSFSNNKFKSETFKQVYYWGLVSRKNRYRFFSINVYQYSSTKDATEKFNDLINQIKTVPFAGEIIFPKDWNYALVSKQYIFRIEGSCSYSKDEWDKITKKFYATVKKNINAPIEGTIYSWCGGGTPTIE